MNNKKVAERRKEVVKIGQKLQRNVMNILNN